MNKSGTKKNKKCIAVYRVWASGNFYMVDSDHHSFYLWSVDHIYGLERLIAPYKLCRTGKLYSSV